ncbi:DUF1499 domain-containing protein [Halomonas sp. MCCC 1A11036]|uniref:DUF1499 domain-containing protein n=1 Tax=Billgrantia zhangzhouensis TaxID=2733481 RepID=A0ABS9AH33_9GAMM|nr:DUF1499 domain-containing protein [Halomonas zhangzhouensis]MCE8021029.1 DUF1499 domain-containing protein [Halomonas zhangzhouensis]
MSALNRQRRLRGGRWPARIAWLSVLLLLLAALLLAGAGPAYRLDLLPLGSAFGMLRRGIQITAGAAAVGLLALLVSTFCRRLQPALLGGLVVAAAAIMLAMPWLHWQRAQTAPPIHDITTDTENPPAFEALAAAREAAPNAVEYPGEAFARQQHEAYPDIEPLVLELPLGLARDVAEAAVLDLGWEIADNSLTRLEATDTTTWFGFKDDVSIRLTETGEGVRIDVRSASRLGRGDMGANAARIRDYFEAIERRLD